MGKRKIRKVRIDSNGVCHQSLFTRTKLMKDNPFNLKYKIAADFDFEYKMSLTNRFYYVDIPISVTEVDEGVSVYNRANIYKEMFEIKNQPFKLIPFLNAYLRDLVYSIPLVNKIRSRILINGYQEETK